MDERLVTAIITTYKRPVETLKRAINSVLNQTYRNIELLIVDDNTDLALSREVEELVFSFNDARRILYLKNDGMHGACAARNLGARNSEGEVLAFLDDDDEWCNKKISIMLPLLCAQVGLVYCKINSYRGTKLIEDKAQMEEVDNPLYEMLKRNFIGGCSVPIIQKKVFFAAGEFDSQMQAAQDVDLWLRIIKLSDVLFVNQALVNYYITDGSITRNFKKQNAGRRRILDKYKAEFEQYPELKGRMINSIISTNVLDGEYQEALDVFESYYETYSERIKNLSVFAKAFLKKILNSLRGYN